MALHHHHLRNGATAEPIMDVSVTSSFGSPIMFNPKRGIEASAGVLKDILLGNEAAVNDNTNESFQSNADFEDLDQMQRQKMLFRHPTAASSSYNIPYLYRGHQSVRHRQSRSVAPTGPSSMSTSSIDLRRVGAQMSRPHSQSPASRPHPQRRYSPPQGSTGSGGTKSPEHGMHGGPLSTSSPNCGRRQLFRAPYYVADTHESSLEGPFYIDHNSSGGSSGAGSVFPSFPIRHHHHHHLQGPPPPRHHFDLSMVSAIWGDDHASSLLVHLVTLML